MLKPLFAPTGTISGSIAMGLTTNYHIEEKHGDRRSSQDMARNSEAVKKLSEVCGWLHLVAARWIGIGWSGGPSTPVDRVHAVYQDRKFQLRIGRYRGFLVEMSDDEGHPVTPEMAWKRWNDRYPTPEPKPVPQLKVLPSPTPVPSPASIPTKVAVTFSTEAAERILRSVFPKRVEDLVTKDQLYESIAEEFKVGHTTKAEKQALGQFLSHMTRRGYVTELASGMFGFEDKALSLFAIATEVAAAPKPPEPAPIQVVEIRTPRIASMGDREWSAQPEPIQIPEATPTPAPVPAPTPAMGLLQQLAQLKEQKATLDAVNREHESVTGRLGTARTHITQLASQILGLQHKLKGWQEEEAKLSTRLRELAGQLHQLRDVEATVQLLSTLTGR